MNPIQEMLSLLPAITGIVLAVVALLTAMINLLDQVKEAWIRLKPVFKYLILFATQFLPIVTIVWYFMYWAVEYHDRFTDPIAFLLLVLEPTLMIVVYEIFWGLYFYPAKLIPMLKNTAPSTPVPQNTEQKPQANTKPSKKRS
jgi:hypothetical protein